MSDSPNMSYCQYRNTRLAMVQVLESLKQDGIEDLSRDERWAFFDLYHLCIDFIQEAESCTE